MHMRIVRAVPGTDHLLSTTMKVQRGECSNAEHIWVSLDHRIKHLLQARGHGCLWQHTHVLCSFSYKGTNCSDAVFWGQGLTLQFQAAQEQRGNSDCGLFALSFARSLCAGEKPRDHICMYSIILLHAHLIECLTKRSISSFPTTYMYMYRRRKAPPPLLHTSAKIFCKCRLPENGRMIQCDACREWFHSQCVSVPGTIQILILKKNINVTRNNSDSHSQDHKCDQEQFRFSFSRS